MVVVCGGGEQVGVQQQPLLSCVDGGEHFTDCRDPDLLLVEHAPLLCEEDAVGDGRVGVCVRVVVQANHVAFGDEVEEDRSEEGEEADDSAEGGLQGKALHSYTSFQQDLGHDDEAGPAAAVGEQLHS